MFFLIPNNLYKYKTLKKNLQFKIYNSYGKFKKTSQVKIYNSKNGRIAHEIKILTKTNTLCILSVFLFIRVRGSKAVAKKWALCIFLLDFL